MKSALTLITIILRLNRFLLGIALGALTVFMLGYGLFALVAWANPSFAATINIPPPPDELVGFIAIIGFAAVAALFRVCTLSLRLLKSSSENGFPNNVSLLDLKRLRMTLFTLFALNLVGEIVATLTRGKLGGTELMSGVDLLTTFGAVPAILIKLAESFLIIQLPGMTAPLAALFVLALEYYVRENQSLKQELQDVV